MNNKITSFFTNKEMLRNGRGIGILIVIISLPLLWFGYKDTFKINDFLTFEFGSITLLITLSIYLATKETKTRAFEDSYMNQENKLQELNDSKNKNAKTINKKDPRLKYTMQFMIQYNNDQQEMYNEIKTNKAIQALSQRIRSLYVKGKENKAHKLEKEIERLKENPLVDKRFRDYDPRKIVSEIDTSIKLPKKKGNNEIDVNPKSVSAWVLMTRVLFNAIGVGAIGALTFSMGASAGEVVLFYFFYAISISMAVMLNYIITSWQMENTYKNSLIKIISIQELLIEKFEELKQQEQNKQKAAESTKQDFDKMKETKLIGVGSNG